VSPLTRRQFVQRTGQTVAVAGVASQLGWLAGCVLVALLWSACSGVVLVELIYAIGNSV